MEKLTKVTVVVTHNFNRASEGDNVHEFAAAHSRSQREHKHRDDKKVGRTQES